MKLGTILLASILSTAGPGSVMAQQAPVGAAASNGVATPEASATLTPLSESLKGEARAEYAAARVLFEDADYSGALTKLTTAYRLSADPRLLWNMAAAEKNLRHYSKVIDYVRRFLAAGAPYVGEEDRAQAEQLLAAVQGFVSEVVLDVNPDAASVEVDGQSIGTTPLREALALDFGHRTMRISKPGYRTEERKLELDGGKPVKVAVTLTPEPHEGTLKVVTDPQTRIRVDGKVVGVGMWQAVVATGSHTVQLEGDRKVAQVTEVVVADGESRAISILLSDMPEEKQRGMPTWVWVAGGVAAVGLGTGAYFLFHKSEDRPAIQEGTWRTLEF